MKTNEWLTWATEQLNKVAIPTARLDCLILLEDTAGKDRAWLLAHPEFELKPEQAKELNTQIKRRTKHEPLAYIRGKTEFYGRNFAVNEHTLEPRPETETMIELLKSLPIKDQSVVDVGTGSGCIAITAKLECSEILVFATDIDKKCIQTAQENATKHSVNIDFRQGNLLEPLFDDLTGSTYAESGVDLSSSSEVRRITNTLHEQHRRKSSPDPQTSSRVFGSAEKQAVGGTWILLANLPYVPDRHTINQAAMFEPKHAIFGGSDGLDLYREMFNQLDAFANKPVYILTESLPFQHEELAKIVNNHGFKQLKEDDFIQVFSYA